MSTWPQAPSHPIPNLLFCQRDTKRDTDSAAELSGRIQAEPTKRTGTMVKVYHKNPMKFGLCHMVIWLYVIYSNPASRTWKSLGFMDVHPPKNSLIHSHEGMDPWIFRWLHRRDVPSAPRSNVSAKQRGNLFLHGAIRHRKNSRFHKRNHRITLLRGRKRRNLTVARLVTHALYNPEANCSGNQSENTDKKHFNLGMLRGWWRVIFRIFTPQSNTLLAVYPYIPHFSWLNPMKSPCVMVSCWVKTKRKSEYPKGELPSRRTNWCQFVHHSQAEEQDVSLHWWNLDLEFDEVRDMFMGIHWVNLNNTYTYIYIYI